jgi:hypothetical protein
MTNFKQFSVPYSIDTKYAKKAAYFSMEFAIHQPLKIYSGGLGFLSGSHLRSAYELRQNLIGIGKQGTRTKPFRFNGTKRSIIFWKIPGSSFRS